MEVTQSMVNYVNKYFGEYVPEDCLKEAILCQSLFPDNLYNVKKLDDFLWDILKEKLKTIEKNIEKMFWKSLNKKMGM